MILVIDLDLAHIFTCDTEEGAACFVEAIQLMGHEPKVIRKPEVRAA